MKKFNRVLLIPIGLLLMCAVMIIQRYASFSDGIYGLMTGVGLGVMISGFIRLKPKASKVGQDA